VEASEVKDKLIKEAFEELTYYYAVNSRSISFPEMSVPLQVMLRKFKKHVNNSSYRKVVQAFLE
jgi:hypothetical protein